MNDGVSNLGMLLGLIIVLVILGLVFFIAKVWLAVIVLGWAGVIL